MRPVGTIQSVRMERRAIVSRVGVTNTTGGLIPTQAKNTLTDDVPVPGVGDETVLRERGTWVPDEEP